MNDIDVLLSQIRKAYATAKRLGSSWPTHREADKQGAIIRDETAWDN
jgi:hypothetical protein